MKSFMRVWEIVEVALMAVLFGPGLALRERR
jgi:hypothetical protein